VIHHLKAIDEILNHKKWLACWHL